MFVRGEFVPVAPNDPSIQYWDSIGQQYNYLSKLSVGIYDKDLHVSDSFRRSYREEKEIKKRGVIKRYSFGASRRCKFYFRNTAHLMSHMINLTYPKNFPMDGLLVKEHLHKFLLWLKYYGYQYLWVLEFQERGAPHFHILVDKEIDQDFVRSYWFKMVDSGDRKHLKRGAVVEAIRSKGSVGHYMTSYLEKDKQKIVPREYQKVGRFWGHSDDLLTETKIKIHGSREDIKKLKADLKVAKLFNQAQKKVWDKNAREKAEKLGKKRKKFKKTFSGYTGFSLKLFNADKLCAELSKRDIILWPYRLLGIPPVPPANPNGWQGRGRLPETVEENIETLKLELESYDDLLRDLGLY